MDGLQTLVDAVGGVTVNNDFAFRQKELITQKVGNTWMDGRLFNILECGMKTQKVITDVRVDSVK